MKNYVDRGGRCPLRWLTSSEITRKANSLNVLLLVQNMSEIFQTHVTNVLTSTYNFVKTFPCSSVVLEYEPRYGDFSVSLPLLWYKIAYIYFLCAYLVKSSAMFLISRPQSSSVSSSPGSSRSPTLESEKTLGTRLSPGTRSVCTSKTAHKSLFGK